MGLKKELGDKAGAALTRFNLGNLALAQGDYTTAQMQHEQGLALYQKLKNK